MTINRKRIISITISSLLAITFLYLAFNKVNINIMLTSLKQAKFPYLLLSVTSFFMSLSTRSLLWKKTFGMNSKIKFGSLFGSVVIGQMGNNILPFRGGELLRVYSISSREQLSKSQCLSTVVVERLFDFASLVILTGFVSYFIEIPVYLRRGLIVICGATVFALALLIYIANVPETANLIFGRLEKILPHKFRDRLDRSLNQLLLGLTSLNNPRTIFSISFLSLITWVLVCLSYFFALMAYNLNIAWILPLFLLALLNIGMMVPTVPASFGIYQFFSITALTYFGIDKSVALGFSFMLQAVDFIPSTLLGLLFFLAHQRMSFKQVALL